MTDQPVPAAAALAAAPSTPASAPSADASSRPRTWWQWVLLYPAVALALLTAAPDWIDRGLALWNGVLDDRMSEAKARMHLFERNDVCMSAPYNLYPEPTKGRKIDATLCPTGDIYVRVLIPDDTSTLAKMVDGQLYRERKDFVSLEKFLVDSEKFAGLDLFSMTATAATLPQSVPQIDLKANGDLVQVQDQFALVVCQKFVDERNLLRHLQVEGQCFDEMIDTYTGVTVSRVAVPCRQSC